MKFNELLQVWDLNYKLLRDERESDSKYALWSTQFNSCVFGCALITDLDSAMIAALMSWQWPLKIDIVFQETSAVQLICCLHLFFLVPFSSGLI